MKEKALALICRTLGVPEGTVQEDMTFAEIPQWDSLMQLMIASALQEELGLTIPMEKLLEITDVRGLLAAAGVTE